MGNTTCTQSHPSVTYVDGCAGIPSTETCDKSLSCPTQAATLGPSACSLPGAYTILGSARNPLTASDCKGGAFIPFKGGPAAGGLCARAFTKADMQDDIVFTQAPTSN